jgi:hypothetical protein
MRGEILLEKTNLIEIEQHMNNLDAYFISTGFIDMLPTALRIAKEFNSGAIEMAEAICKLSDKFKRYPPTRNRVAWFEKVFREKLGEAMADILAFRKGKRYK